MGRCIVQIGGKYLIWSEIVDAPVTYGMTISELVRSIEQEEGVQGLRDLPDRLERVWKRGHSMTTDSSTLEEFVMCNRAGPSDEELTLEEIEKMYVRRETWVPKNGVAASALPVGCRRGAEG